MRRLWTLIIGGAGAASYGHLLAVLIPAGLLIGGGLTWWANSAWESHKEGLRAEGRQQCQTAVEAASAKARKLALDQARDEIDRAQKAAAAANKARAEDAVMVEQVRSAAREQYLELQTERAKKAPTPECVLSDAVVDILNRPLKRAP